MVDRLALSIKNQNFEDIDFSANYILCSNNAFRSLEKFENYKGLIILDGSNKKWIVEKLLAEAKQKSIKISSLYETGSQTFKF